MAETLGSLIDKITIVKLKQWHSDDNKKLESLSHQEQELIKEIDLFVEDSISGNIPLNKLVFESNKVYKKDNIKINLIDSLNIGQLTSDLAETNCKLWHEQEKVYDFENISIDQKDEVINKIATLNLERNQYIDKIDKSFQGRISNI
jgi:hypothetical protein